MTWTDEDEKEYTNALGNVFKFLQQMLSPGKTKYGFMVIIVRKPEKGHIDFMTNVTQKYAIEAFEALLDDLKNKETNPPVNMEKETQ